MSYFDTYIGHDKAEGQIIYWAIPEGVPPGVLASRIITLPVRLTIVDTSDISTSFLGVFFFLKNVLLFE